MKNIFKAGLWGGLLISASMIKFQGVIEIEKIIEIILQNLPKTLQGIAILGISKAVFNIFKYLHDDNKNLRARVEELEENQCIMCKLRVDEN